MIFELAAFNTESVVLAGKLNVLRIEFCADYSLGGITPSMEDVNFVRKVYPYELLAMVRLRGGNFLYRPEELFIMKDQIVAFKSAGVDGIVFGCLDEKDEIDVSALAMLMDWAGATPVTFHRAIDKVQDFDKGIETLIAFGVRRVLTSGSAGSAMEGKENLKRIQHKFGNSIEVVAGGGVRSTNIKPLLEHTGVTSFHSAALTFDKQLPDVKEIKALLQYAS